jgi:hypothetical protein
MVRTLTGPYMITTSPSVTTCTRCKKGPVLAATVDGFDQHIDPTTLSWQGELRALMEGLATYEMHGDLLIRRTPLRIEKGSWNGPVLADHACRQRWAEHERDDAVIAQAIGLISRLLGVTAVLPEPGF